MSSVGGAKGLLTPSLPRWHLLHQIKSGPATLWVPVLVLVGGLWTFLDKGDERRQQISPIPNQGTGRKETHTFVWILWATISWLMLRSHCNAMWMEEKEKVEVVQWRWRWQWWRNCKLLLLLSLSCKCTKLLANCQLPGRDAKKSGKKHTKNLYVSVDAGGQKKIQILSTEKGYFSRDDLTTT